jgi:protein ImuA
LLFDAGDCAPRFPGLLLARAAAAAGGGAAVFCDPRRELHPTAIAMAGVDLRRVILLRPRNAGQEISALAECLRCKGVSATLCLLDRLSDIEARRLQLAAEAGGGVGIFLRPQARNTSRGSASHYAAATRWRVKPAAKSDAPAGKARALEDGDTQGWIIELLHGHGGQLGESVLLEVDRETGELLETSDVRASSALARRPPAPAQSRATA